MNPNEKRKQIFIDTMQWINEDNDLQEAVQSSIRNEEVYYENEAPQLERELKETVISVTKERTLEAVQRLQKTFPDAKIAAMNFANAFYPGGGVKSGASAQEECLCRCSTLYPCISAESMLSTYYRHHRLLKDDLATDSLIYTPDVVVCKTDTAFPERMRKEEWYKVDIMTIAAPDLRRFTISDEELYQIHYKRITHMLAVAAGKNAEILVTGAFGCGAFRNDPQIVAKAFHDAIENFPEVFQQICFAIYCPPQEEANYNAFMKMFS